MRACVRACVCVCACACLSFPCCFCWQPFLSLLSVGFFLCLQRVKDKSADLCYWSRYGRSSGTTVGRVVGARISRTSRVGGACGTLGHKASHGLADACCQNEVLPKLYIRATFGCNKQVKHIGVQQSNTNVK